MTTLHIRCKRVALISVSILAATASLSAEPSQQILRQTDCWQIRTLDTFGGDFSLAYDLNDSGQVVGVAFTSDGTAKAFISASNGGALTAIDPPGTFTSLTATSINNAGQVIGTLFQINVPPTAFVTDPGGTNPRPTIRYADPRGINNVGQTLWDISYPYMKAVIGPSEQPANSDGVGLIEVDVLPAVDPAERFFLSTGLNDAGQVAVTAYRSPIVPNDPGTLPAAYRWSSFEGAILLVPDADYSLAYGINDVGQVIGNVNRGGVDQAFVTRRHSVEIEMLGTPGDGNFPADINNHSQIVGSHFLPDGTSYGYVTAPFRVHHSIRIDSLREVVRGGWNTMEPQAISNRGQIAGYGRLNETTRAFLLTPLSPNAYLPTPDGAQPKCYRPSRP